MIVTEQPEKAAELLDRADSATESLRTEGWHVTDLVQCLRKTWYDRSGKYARPPTPVDRAYFLLGKSQHALLQAASPEHSEMPVWFKLGSEMVYGTIDAYWPGSLDLFGFPVEIKTTRSNDLKEPAFGMPHYVEQLAAYCIATGETTGTLAVWYIFASPPMLRVWDIAFTQNELKGFRSELERRLTIVAQNDTIPSDQEHRKGECDSCRYFKKGGGPCSGNPLGRDNFFLQSNYSSLEPK